MIAIDHQDARIIGNAREGLMSAEECPVNFRLGIR